MATSYLATESQKLIEMMESKQLLLKELNIINDIANGLHKDVKVDRDAEMIQKMRSWQCLVPSGFSIDNQSNAIIKSVMNRSTMLNNAVVRRDSMVLDAMQMENATSIRPTDNSNRVSSLLSRRQSVSTTPNRGSLLYKLPTSSIRTSILSINQLNNNNTNYVRNSIQTSRQNSLLVIDPPRNLLSDENRNSVQTSRTNSILIRDPPRNVFFDENIDSIQTSGRNSFLVREPPRNELLNMDNNVVSIGPEMECYPTSDYLSGDPSGYSLDMSLASSDSSGVIFTECSVYSPESSDYTGVPAPSSSSSSSSYDESAPSESPKSTI